MARVALAANFWLAAVGVMVFATAADGLRVLTGWSVLLALAGSVFTVWHLIVQERQRVETIAKLLARQEKPEGMRRV